MGGRRKDIHVHVKKKEEGERGEGGRGREREREGEGGREREREGEVLTCPTSSNAITTTAPPNFLTIFAFSTKSSSPSFKLIELIIHFPWEHLRPASTTEKLLESIQRGSYKEVKGKE